MCSRGVSRHGLMRDFTQEPPLFCFLSLFDYFSLFLLLAFRAHNALSLHHTCRCACSHTDTHAGLCSHWAQARIFLTWCAFSPPHSGCMASLKIWFWCLWRSLAGTWICECVVNEYAQKMLIAVDDGNGIEHSEVNRIMCLKLQPVLTTALYFLVWKNWLYFAAHSWGVT